MRYLIKKQIPKSFLIALICIIIVEIGFFRSNFGKDFLITWASYAKRNAWFPLLRIQYLKNLANAKNAPAKGTCVVGTSTAASAFTNILINPYMKDYHILTTVLSGGENILLQLSQTISLPQKNIILFLSEFSFYQPFSKYPIPDIINLNSFFLLRKIFYENPLLKTHPMFSAIKKSIIYDIIQSLRFSNDFKHAMINYLSYTLFKRTINYPSLILQEATLTEMQQACSLNLDNEYFKIYYFFKIIDLLLKNNKNIIIIRTRFHSKLNPYIKRKFSKKFDYFISSCHKRLDFQLIDLKKDIKINDSDFQDYTHFSETGRKKIKDYLLNNGEKKYSL